jgi:RNA polymerase sigma-70 factor
MHAALRALHGSDLYLCCGCALGELAALHAFEEKMIPVAKKALERTGTTKEVCDDVLQQLRMRRFVPDAEGTARIHSYSGRGPLPSWLRVAVVRLMLNLKQSEQRYVPVASVRRLIGSGRCCAVGKIRRPDQIRSSFFTPRRYAERARLLISDL